jgi:hypothetical protein
MVDWKEERGDVEKRIAKVADKVSFAEISPGFFIICQLRSVGEVGKT